MHTEQLGVLARGQGGVFARWQAYELGFTKFMIARRLATKEWVRVLGNHVYMSATSHLDERSSAWAACLACGPGAVLSGPSAVRWHGLDVAPPNAVEWEWHWATVPPERHVRAAKVRTIREAVSEDDIMLLAGMRITTVERSIVDTLRVLPPWAAYGLLDRALLRGWITVDALDARTHELVGRRGVGRLREHLARVIGGARSEAERRLHAIIAEAGLSGWTANCEVVDEDGVLQAIVDVAFAAARVAVEVDGLAFHRDPEQFQRDRSRQNWLVRRGWTVLRFTWDDLTMRRRYVLDTIRAALDTTQDPTLRSESQENLTG